MKCYRDEKGFGFIDPDDGGDPLFVQFSSISMKGFRTLGEGQRVCFEVVQGPKGMLAVNVTVFKTSRGKAEIKLDDSFK